MTIKLIVPLRVHIGGKKEWFSLNLNTFRNNHYHVLNKAKKQFKKDILLQCSALPYIECCHIHYTIYPSSKRLFDLDNVVSIIAKFTQDVLVETKCLKDDNYKYIISSSNAFGFVDITNPRCEVEIIPITNK